MGFDSYTTIKFGPLKNVVISSKGPHVRKHLRIL